MKRLLLCILLAFAPVTLQAEVQERVLVVGGSGTTVVAPDMAIINVGVSQQAPKAEIALKKTSEAMTRMQDRLAKMGVDARDIQTVRVSLNAIYDHRNTGQPRKIVGFQASNAVTVRVHDLTRVGSVLGALVADGANEIGGIQFDMHDKQDALDQARQRAVADAKRKAELMAAASGVKITGVLSIREGGASVPQPRLMAARMDMAEMAVPIAEGQMRLSATVSMEYAIE